MHGPGGAFPLEAPNDETQPKGCGTTKDTTINAKQRNLVVAAISLSGLRFLPGPDDFGFLDGNRKKKRTRENRGKRNPDRKHQPTQTQKGGKNVTNHAEPTDPSTPNHQLNAKQTNFHAKCPMAKVPGLNAAIGGLLQLTTKPHKLSCPMPIVKLRAALAKTEAVKNLRPKQVPVKILAVAGAGTAANVPLGMWREHTEKFSLAWFLAVHASLPFVISLRKACVMPRYAVLFTITAAVVGQALGARVERERMRRVKPSLNRCGAPTASTIDHGGLEVLVS